MSEYKRFMAYLYTYERGQKAGNCGFAKVMVRDQAGFVNFHVKLPNQKARAGCTVYLYYRSEDKSRMYGVSIGEFVIANGVGEGSIHFPATEIGIGRRFFTEMGGLYLILDNERIIATEWEDIPVRPESFQIESEAGEEPDAGSMGSVEPETSSAEILAEEERNEEDWQEESAAQEKQSANEPVRESVLDREVVNEENNQQEMAVADGMKRTDGSEQGRQNSQRMMQRGNVQNSNVDGQGQQNAQGNDVQKPVQVDGMQNSDWIAHRQQNSDENSQEKQNSQSASVTNGMQESQPEIGEPDYDTETDSEPELTVTDENQIHAASAPVAEKDNRMCMGTRSGCCPYRMQGRNRQAAYGADTRRQAKEPERISPLMDKWTQLKSRYPVVSPFDNDDSITCIRIQPKDICLLNRREWVLGNNNFLLHGYCNYRYLLLGKIEAEGKYIICVPGNFYSKEKMMASMFGFQNFKMAGDGELRQGEFGYWYREIEL